MSQQSVPPPDDRDQAVQRAIDEFISRRASDPRVDEESFVRQHADLLPELGERLRRLHLIDQARQQPASQRSDKAPHSPVFGTSLEVQCPFCHSRTTLLAATPWNEVVCESCGNMIDLGGQQRTKSRTPLTTIDQFELLERCGVGTFGTVWRAWDTILERDVAVKIPRVGQLNSNDTKQFLHEAKAAAQLRHPNIVSVHEVRQYKGFPYMVSDFVDGVSLSEWLDRDQPDVETIAELCRKLATALQHAHAKGVVHRDLKSANVLIDCGGEPHITDFGLAKRTNIDMTTLDGDVLGTPAYMSPEQAMGASHEADARSDIYSLGVVLFYALTGQLPFRGSAHRVIHQVIHEKPPRLRKLSAEVPAEVEQICLRCLEKEPARRFQSAAELAGQLQKFLDGEFTSPQISICRKAF